MPRRASPYGVGANPELEAAFARAASLDYGERLTIPTESTEDAGRLRRYFFRLRKRAQAQALTAGHTLDPSEADPWRGLVTDLQARPPALVIRRPVKLATITLTRADGSIEEVKL